MSEYILEVRDLNIQLKENGKLYPAVENFSMQIRPGETVGIIGESGSGKSISCMAIMGLLSPAKWNYDGEIFIKGESVPVHDNAKMQKIRGKKIALIMQNPISAFDSVITIRQHFIETMEAHTEMSRTEICERAVLLLHQMHIQNPEKVLQSYPFQCSGGMLQRIMIALAIMMEPDIIIADEPTTALDRTIQREIIKLLQELKRKTKMAMILVSHDLGVMSHLADQIYVMYSGNLIEKAETDELLENPVHPYTKGLFRSRPAFSKERLSAMEGYPPTLKKRGEKGCHFYERCSVRSEDCICFSNRIFSGEEEHFVSCRKAGEKP